MITSGTHILSSRQFDVPSLERIFALADFLQPVARGEMVTRVLEGAVLGSLFFEASTRTRLSFDSAFMRLGGSVSHTTGVTFSSIIKGESLEDTSRVISGYVDAFVIRHPEVEAIHQFASATHVPVINGGNGEGEHPTQALLDIYTMRNELQRLGKKLENATIAMVGDLRFGRTIHSLIQLLLLFPDTCFLFVAPKGLELPDHYREMVEAARHRFTEKSRLDKSLAGADVVYVTRVQKERIPVTERFDDTNLKFRIDKSSVQRFLSPTAVIMHPLPRDSTAQSNDLSADIDGDPRLAIFRQSDAGVPVRMALFGIVLGVEDQVRRSLRPATWWRPQKIGPLDLEEQTSERASRSA
ncbi:MAG TPA: aspartate carbamoyltransferase [Burkholderiales bacterium]|nr:aspartate carbamoyltransferase [Burkholderiales bacterium]